MNDLTKIIIAAIVGIVLKPVGEYLVAMLQFNFTGFRVRKVGGNWKSSWSFSDTDKSESHSDIVELRQFGPFIRGRARGDGHHYTVTARLNPDGFIHGTWKDIQDSTDWYGSFKLKIQTDGKKMIGKWIGKSSAGVRAGDWTLERC